MSWGRRAFEGQGTILGKKQATTQMKHTLMVLTDFFLRLIQALAASANTAPAIKPTRQEMVLV